MPQPFVHLHLHSEFSLLDSTLRLKQLVQRTQELGMPAVAVTDQFNMFALVKFYQAAVAAGIKPIAGADVLVSNPDEPDQSSRIVLLCQDQQGYLNLCKLLSKGYQEGQYHGVPFLRRDWITQHAAGLIALSGGREGDIGQALINQHPNQARQYANAWIRDFPQRFYIEIQRTARDQEDRHERHALILAAELDLPVVATNDVRFLERGDFSAHEARVCIHDGRLLSDKRRQVRYSDEQYLKSPAEMAELFADLPEALENASELAKRCNLEMQFGTNYLPDFPTPDGESIETYLRSVSLKGLSERLNAHAPAHDFTDDDYRERLELELKVINDMGFPGYFLIVADFIHWAKNNDIPVGPGRGSGAGSLVAYALKVTDLDPLQFDLLFERFLNPERISLPDFDVDFCMEKRDLVIDYVAGKYGRDQVSQIITYGTMAARAVVRDCGRVLGHGYGFVDSIAKLVPMELHITLEKALQQEPELKKRYDDEEDTQALLDLAMSLEGLTRNAGKHAGGVVIAPSPLTDFSPLFCEAGGGSVVTQFDKDDVETIGLVKFDFLGLRTLTIIDWALKAINQQLGDEGKDPVVLEDLPMDDAKTYELLQDCRTTAVFQLESRGMKDLIRKLQPDNFNEIIALVALFRPGPLESGMVGDYIERKHGRAVVSFPHNDLEPILRPTYGVILYQEQVMQIAQVLAGYSLGDADILRRAMGKKKAAVMAKQRLVFVDGAAERGVSDDLANYIFDQMETFAGYGFNKSHSAAYALIAYQTAFLKAHYPAAFMAAVLSADMDNTDKIAAFISECRKMALNVLPPDINQSAYAFKMTDPQSISYGLGAIKGIGRAAIDTIEAEREANGPYSGLDGFCNRMDLKKANKRALETLVRSGALDTLDPDHNRARLLHDLPRCMHAAEQLQRDAEAGQSDMFGTAAVVAVSSERELSDISAWPELQKLQAEKDSLGLYLTGHPVQVHLPDIKHFATCVLGNVHKHVLQDSKNRRGVAMTLAALVTPLKRRTPRGYFIAIEDHTGRADAFLSNEIFATYADLMEKDEIVVIEGNVVADDFTGSHRITANHIMSLAAAKARFAQAVSISVSGPDEDLCDALAATFSPYQNGSSPVHIHYRNPRARVSLELGQDWTVKPCEELIAALNELEAVQQASLRY
ncbi:MAG: DNA polymerase III subunit alpha [Gammaproteobacteria bacterium]|nr:MAG: DNA polymerase III subunit alpha [Gammaproteobacteria bacterium]